jgi:hypothetical protein
MDENVQRERASLGKTAANLKRSVWEVSLDPTIANAVTRLAGAKRAQGYVPPLVIGAAKPTDGR